MGGWRGARVAFLSQGVASSGNFVLSVLLVRALGLGAFGVLSLVLIAVGYAAGLGQALVCQPLLSLAPTVEGDARRARVGDALWLGVGLAGLVAIVAAALVVAFESGGLDLLGHGIQAVPLAALAALRVLAPTVRGALYTLRHARATIAMDALGSWGACVGVWWIGGDGGATVGLCMGVLTLAALGASGLGLFVLRGAMVGGRPSRAALGRHWRSGRWLAGNQVLSWFGTGGFHGATVALVGPAGVGAIRAAQSLVGVLLVGCQALELALPARAAEAFRMNGRAGLARWCRAQGAALAAGFAALGACVWVLGPRLSHMLFPDVDPELTGLALGGLAWLPAASVLNGLLQVSFRTLEDTRPVFLAYATSAVASAAVALPLVGAFGVAGAAWGLTGAQAVFAGLLMVLFPRGSGRGHGGAKIERTVSIRHS